MNLAQHWEPYGKRNGEWRGKNKKKEKEEEERQKQCSIQIQIHPNIPQLAFPKQFFLITISSFI